MRRSTHFWLALGFTVATLFACLTALPPGQAAEPDRKKSKERLVDRVRTAIEHGVRYLRDKQRADGSWEVEKLPFAGGATALATLALLQSGVSPEDPVLKRSLDYLRKKVPPTHTYVVSLQIMVFTLTGKPEDRALIQRNVDWLLAARTAGGWSYTRGTGKPDNSNSQYALLALHEALLAGAKVDPKALKAMQDHYLKTQDRQGGWTYQDVRGEPTLTMTTAGLCNLIITGLDFQIGKEKLDEKTGVAENCGLYKENEAILRALSWLGRRMPAKLDDEMARSWVSPFYALYGLERAGRLTGQHYLGDVDWYRLGCEYLVENQDADGSWKGRGDRGAFDNAPLVATSFALLFLSKGRTPILITKLAHGEGSGWNNKHSDARHLVEFASRELFKRKPMGWQVFDVRNKERPRDDKRTEQEFRSDLAAELLQSPIVYVNGHNLKMTSKVQEILKEYLDNGGFLFAEACCGREEFDKGFRQLIKTMYPDDALVKLPADHPVYTASFTVSPKEFPLYGVQMGCKTVAIYSPQPLAGYWEANLFSGGRGQKAFQLGANVIAYATGLEPPHVRLTEVELFKEDTSARTKKNYLEAAQLTPDEGSRPADRALLNLMGEQRKNGLDVVVTREFKKVPLASAKVSDYRFLYMHGRGKFDAGTTKELNKLLLHLKTGGTLLADACCGSEAFDKSFRQFMEVLWSEEKLKLEPIPLDDELFSKALNGMEINAVKCRRELPGGKRDAEYKVVAPKLEGIKYNKRWVVIYSKYDLGCALEKHRSSDCLGHDYDSALLLGRAAVLYALKR